MKIEWKSCFRIGVSIFLLYLCIFYWPGAAKLLISFIGAAKPLLVGCIVAYLLNILMSFYERHYFPGRDKPIIDKSRRPVCMAAAFITLIAIIVLVIRIVVPQLVSCVQLIIAILPGTIDSLVAELENLDILPENITDTLSDIDWQSKIGQVFKVLTSGVGNVVDMVVSTVSSVVSGFVTVLLGIIFSIYLLAEKEKLTGQFNRLIKRYMRKNWREKTLHVFSIMNDCFHKYIVGQCTEAVILGLLCALGMWILQLPYAAMIGALTAFTALIPVAGAYIGGGVGAFMIFTVSPSKAVIFLIFIVVLQQLEGNLIYPRVVGSSIGLPAIWVLAAVTVGGGMMGVVGMLLGVPLATTVYRLLREDINKHE